MKATRPAENLKGLAWRPPQILVVWRLNIIAIILSGATSSFSAFSLQVANKNVLVYAASVQTGKVPSMQYCDNFLGFFALRVSHASLANYNGTVRQHKMHHGF